MGQADSNIKVRILVGKKECDKFMNGQPHIPTINRTFTKESEAVSFLHRYRIGYGDRGFAIFLNKSLPIKPLHFQGLEFIQYEF